MTKKPVAKLSIDPNVQLFAVEACPMGTSPDRVAELARRLQREINAWCEQEAERDEELRSLKGYDAQDIAEKY